MDKKKIQKIFSRKLRLEVKNIVDTSKGVDQEVKIVETPKGKFVIKIPHKEKNKIIRQKLATKLCSEKGIPVPKVILSNNKYLIESYLEGKDLDEIRLNKKDTEKIYFELGRILKKIHDIQGKKFGPVNSRKLKGKFKTQIESIESWFMKDLGELTKRDYFSSKEIESIKQKYKEGKRFLRTKLSVMLHSDFSGSNIRINKNKISGVMDFGDLTLGPPMQDFAQMYLDQGENSQFKKLLEGYGEHNIKEIRFYAFCWSVWKINSRIQEGKFNKKTNRLKEIILQK